MSDQPDAPVIPLMPAPLAVETTERDGKILDFRLPTATPNALEQLLEDLLALARAGTIHCLVAITGELSDKGRVRGGHYYIRGPIDEADLLWLIEAVKDGIRRGEI